MTDSLRLRLTLWYTAALLAALAVFAVLLYASLGRQLYGHHDGELSADAIRTARSVASSSTPASIVNAIPTVSDPPPLLMIRDSAGQMLYRSPALASHESTLGAHDALVHAAAEGQSDAKFFTTQISTLGTVRFICIPTTPQGLFYIQIGEPIGDVAETQRHFRTATLVLVPVVLLLTSVGGYLLAGRALAPVTRISDSLEAIQAEDLSRRIDLNPREAELGRLVRSVNRLLDRLAGAFASLREFAGDASHQLQTPLTVMKGSIDVALSTERDAQAYRLALQEISHETDTMKAILTDLRALSLADAPLRPEGAVERTNLSLVTAEAVEILTALGEASGVRVVSDVATDVMVRADRARLQQVLFNLGENAIKYSSEGDIVTVTLKGGAAEAVLIVGDTGSGISPEDLPHIFDRFYRGKTARGQVSGSGLGLAIARRIVEGQGGAITVDSTATEGTRFTVRWPTTRER
jgi:signal transduction histidine kinase